MMLILRFNSFWTLIALLLAFQAKIFVETTKDGEETTKLDSKHTCYVTSHDYDETKPKYSQLHEKNCPENTPHCVTLTFKSGKVSYDGCWYCPKIGTNFLEGIGTGDCCDTDRCNKPKPFNCYLREREDEAASKCEADGVETFCVGYYDDFSFGKCTNECKNQKLNVRIEGGRDDQGRDRPMMCCDTDMCNMPIATPIRKGDNVFHDLIKQRGEPLPLLPWPSGTTCTDKGISLRLWKYIYHRFMGAEVAECSENGLRMKVKHIYYWPGDHVSLTCKVCRRGLDSNGMIKMWGWAAKVYDFLDHFYNNTRVEEADIGVQFLQLNSEINTNPDEFYGSGNYDFSYMPGNRDQARKHGSLPHIRRQTFEQIGKTLHIHNAEARAAGVYFCYDDSFYGLRWARYFYVLHAMTPITRVDDANLKTRVQLSPDMGKMVCESPGKKDSLPLSYRCGDDCGKPIYMYPDTQWKFNWRPTIYIPENEPICDEGDLTCEKYLNRHPDGGRLAIRKVPETPIDLFLIRRSFVERRFFTNVALAFQWESWSKCDSPHKTHQRREGHCVLLLVGGKNKTNSQNTLFEATRWMSRLDSIFRLSGGKTKAFVRLHSSTVMTMIIGEPVTSDCGTRERSKSVEQIDNFYEHVIFPTLEIPGEDFDRKFTLNNEWRACFKYKHSGEKGSYSDIVGTYVIQTKKCP